MIGSSKFTATAGTIALTYIFRGRKLTDLPV